MTGSEAQRPDITPGAGEDAGAMDLAAAFTGTLEPVKAAPLYRLAQFLVAAAMVALPPAYLAVPALTGYLVFWYATRSFGPLFGTPPSGIIELYVKASIYLVPIVAGSTLVIFMCKPVVARAARHAEPQPLPRTDAPLFFDLVERIAASLRAPMPGEIFVDASTNASASFRRGMAGVITGDLRLTVGLPLVAMLDAPQLASIVAHELGHFAQGGSMRLGYVTSKINSWFARVIVERDSWDERLDALGQSIDARFLLLIKSAKIAAWLGRSVLWVFMRLGHAVSCVLTRQMEYDADRYSARLVGSATAATTLRESSILNVILATAKQHVAREVEGKRLPDDLVALAAAFQVDVQLRHEIVSSESTARTGWFDTHPAQTDRLASIAAEDAAGIFSLDGPAARLIPAMRELSKAATLRLYRDESTIDVDACTSVDTREILSGFDRHREVSAAADRFLFGLKDRWRTFGLPTGEDVVPPGDVARVALELTGVLEGRRDRIALLVERHDAAWREQVEADLAVTVLALGAGPRRASPWANSHSASEPQAALDDAERRLSALEEELGPIQRLVSRRLAACLALAVDPEVAARVPAGDSAILRVPRLTEALESLVAARPIMRPLGRDHARVQSLMAAEIPPGDEDIDRRVSVTASRLRKGLLKGLEQLAEALSGAPWPFDGAPPEARLSHAVVSRIPSGFDEQEVMDATLAVLSAAWNVYHAIMNDLTGIAASALDAIAGGSGVPGIEQGNRRTE